MGTVKFNDGNFYLNGEYIGCGKFTSATETIRQKDARIKFLEEQLIHEQAKSKKLCSVLNEFEAYFDTPQELGNFIANASNKNAELKIAMEKYSKLNCEKIFNMIFNSFDEVTKIKLGAAISVTGKLVESPKEGQEFELVLLSFVLEGDCDDDYPLQAKGRPTREFLREIAYLRPRTNLFNAVFRIRSVAAMAIHSYFQGQGYLYVHTPLITCADCEGSDQMFKITTLNMQNPPLTDEGKVDYSKDLFGKQSFITGSGQLQGETFAMAFGDIYTFGPTFRTENSNTKTHANEFWMIEPEIAFCDLAKDMDIMEDMLKFVVKYESSIFVVLSYPLVPPKNDIVPPVLENDISFWPPLSFHQPQEYLSTIFIFKSTAIL